MALLHLINHSSPPNPYIFRICILRTFDHPQTANRKLMGHRKV